MGKLTFESALGGAVDLVGPATAAIVTLNLPESSGNIVGTGSTGVVTSSMIAGQVAVAQGGTGVATSTGTGSVVLNTSPTLVTPALGTPSSGVLSNATGLPLTSGVTGILPVANGGSGTATPAIVAGTNVTVSGIWPNQTINSTASGTGSVTSVATGTGLTGGPITTSGTIALASTAVTAGSYTAANITVDAQGRVTAAANGSAGGGSVTSVSVVSANGLAGTVATATSTPAITLSTSVTGVLKGNGTAISAATAGTDYLAPGGALGTPSSGTLTNATGLPLTSGVSGVLPVLNGGTGNTTGTATINANLTGPITSIGNATAITAGAIVNADINASAGIADTKLATISTALKVSNSATTAAAANTASAIVARDASGNFAAGTITAALTGTASGNLVSGGALGTPSSGTLTNATGLPLTTGVTGLLPLASGGTGTATPSIVAGTNVTVSGIWPNQTVNATASGSGTVTSVATGTGLTGGPITSTGTIALASTAVTAGSYTAANITVDAQGRLTAAANGTGATVAAGTATALAAGSAPTVTNSGTSTAAIFDFGIPTGATGATGPTGATGTGITAQTVGWTGTAGTTSKTLTVDDDLTTSQAARRNAVNSFTGAQIGTVTALTSSAAAIAVNLATNNNFSHATTENTTLSAPSNAVAGQSGVITITQGATARTLAYNTFWKFPGGIVPTLTATVGAVDVLAYNVESATRATAQLIKDVK